MAYPATDHDEASVGSLVAGILADTQRLMSHEIALARQEIREDIRGIAAVGLGFAVGAALAVFGAVLLLLMLAGALADGLEWPTWAGQGAVGAVLLVAGGTVLYVARVKLRHANLVPEQTLATLEENVAWLKRRTTSGTRSS
jgi:hypothetical protein